MSRIRNYTTKNGNIKLTDFESESDNYRPIKILEKVSLPKNFYHYKVEFVMKYNKANIERLIRRKYTVSDELAILRQKEEKPNEYQEYFDFVEDIKAKLKNGEF